MLPMRTHLSIATTALVLVVPVVVGVASGGYLAGVISVIAGFVVYDYFFIPPYLTLYVGATENWVALVVYAAVMLPVARVVAGMNHRPRPSTRTGPADPAAVRAVHIASRRPPPARPAVTDRDHPGRRPQRPSGGVAPAQ